MFGGRCMNLKLKKVGQYFINMSYIKQSFILCIALIVCTLIEYIYLRTIWFSIATLYLIGIFLPIYISYKKGGLEELGIRKYKKKEIIYMAILTCFFIAYQFFRRYYIYNNYTPLASIPNLLYQIFAVGLGEEILFRGFIGKKFPIKNTFMRYLVVGLLCAFMHLPMYCYRYGLHAIKAFFLVEVQAQLISHIINQLMYDSFDSFVPVAILHGMNNWLNK